MSSADAQKSEVHDTTDDAFTSASNKTNPNQSTTPASNFERGAADADIARNPLAESSDVIEAPPPRHDPQETFPPDVKVKRDESDVGGPIDLEVTDLDVKE